LGRRTFPLGAGGNDYKGSERKLQQRPANGSN
jgi:hypothetical protein